MQLHYGGRTQDNEKLPRHHHTSSQRILPPRLDQKKAGNNRWYFPLEIEDHSAKTRGVKFLWFFFPLLSFMHGEKSCKKKWWKSRILFRWKIDQYFLKKFDEKKEISRFVSNGAWFFFFKMVFFKFFVVVRNPLRSWFRSDKISKCFTALNNVLASFHPKIMRFFRLRVLFYSNGAITIYFWKFRLKSFDAIFLSCSFWHLCFCWNVIH